MYTHGQTRTSGNTKWWQLALHCHLRPSVPTVVVCLNYEAHSTPSYHITTLLELCYLYEGCLDTTDGSL